MDSTAYPHIVDSIIASCDAQTLWTFRSVSRWSKRVADEVLLGDVEVLVHRYAPMGVSEFEMEIPLGTTGIPFATRVDATLKTRVNGKAHPLPLQYALTSTGQARRRVVTFRAALGPHERKAKGWPQIWDLISRLGPSTLRVTDCLTPPGGHFRLKTNTLVTFAHFPSVHNVDLGIQLYHTLVRAGALGVERLVYHISVTQLAHTYYEGYIPMSHVAGIDPRKGVTAVVLIFNNSLRESDEAQSDETQSDETQSDETLNSSDSHTHSCCHDIETLAVCIGHNLNHPITLVNVQALATQFARCSACRDELDQNNGRFEPCLLARVLDNRTPSDIPPGGILHPPFRKEGEPGYPYVSLSLSEYRDIVGSEDFMLHTMEHLHD